MDNTELLERIEKLEKQVELLQAEITAIKNIEVSEKAREQIDKMERANKLVSLMESLSGEKLPDAQKNEELEVLQNISQQAEKEVQSSIGTIEEFIDNSADESDFEWQPYQDGIEITKYVGFDKETVIIPESINNLYVRKIGNEVFLNCKEMHHIILPETIVELGERVFEGSGLEEIKLPNLICEIPNHAFRMCENLQNIYLPNRLSRIGNWAFYSCVKLKKLNLPDTLKNVGSQALHNTSINNIIFPSGGIEFGERILDFTTNHNIKRIAFKGTEDDFWPRRSFDRYMSRCEFIFYCLPGSSAQRYARENDIKVKPLSEFEKDIQEEK